MEEQINEKHILTEMIDLNSEFTVFLYYIQKRIENINDKIQNIDNHFFTNNTYIIDKLYETYDYKNIDKIIHNIEENTNHLSNKLLTCCEKHDFIDDYIDINFDHIKIKYCSICNVSKK